VETLVRYIYRHCDRILIQSRAFAPPITALGADIFSIDGRQLEEVVGTLLREQDLRIALAESCTGGLLAERITSIAGSSRYFLGGAVVYDNSVKIALAGVPPLLIAEHGAVSSQVAAAGGRRSASRGAVRPNSPAMTSGRYTEACIRSRHRRPAAQIDIQFARHRLAEFRSLERFHERGERRSIAQRRQRKTPGMLDGRKIALDIGDGFMLHKARHHEVAERLKRHRRPVQRRQVDRRIHQG
jgi:hypothetical protein